MEFPDCLYNCELLTTLLAASYAESENPISRKHSFGVNLRILMPVRILLPSPLFVIRVGANPSSENTFPFIPLPEGFTLPTCKIFGSWLPPPHVFNVGEQPSGS